MTTQQTKPKKNVLEINFQFRIVGGNGSSEKVKFRFFWFSIFSIFVTLRGTIYIQTSDSMIFGGRTQLLGIDVQFRKILSNE